LWFVLIVKNWAVQGLVATLDVSLFQFTKKGCNYCRGLWEEKRSTNAKHVQAFHLPKQQHTTDLDTYRYPLSFFVREKIKKEGEKKDALD